MEMQDDFDDDEDSGEDDYDERSDISQQPTKILENLIEIVQKDIAPRAVETDTHGTFPTASVQSLADAGYFGLTLPTEVGGMAQPPRIFAAAVEEIAQACASTAMIYVMHVG